MKISGGTGLTWIFWACATASRPPAAMAATPAAAPAAMNCRRLKLLRSSIVPLLPPLLQVAHHQDLDQRRRVFQGPRLRGALESALLVQGNRGPVGGGGPEIQALGGERADPVRHPLHEGGTDASSALR